MVDKIDRATAGLDGVINDLVPDRNKPVGEKLADAIIVNPVKIAGGAALTGVDIAAHAGNIALTPFDKIAKGVEATAAPLINSLGGNMKPYDASEHTKHPDTGVVLGGIGDAIGEMSADIDKANAKLSNFKTGSKIGDVATALTVKPAGTIVLKTVEGATYVASEALHVAGTIEGGVEKIGKGVINTLSPADNARVLAGVKDLPAFEGKMKASHDKNLALQEEGKRLRSLNPLEYDGSPVPPNGGGNAEKTREMN